MNEQTKLGRIRTTRKFWKSKKSGNKPTFFWD